MIVKRIFDIFVSAVGLILFGWLILVCWIAASIETKSNGMFFQKRIGQNGKLFNILKIKTMFDPVVTENRSSVTTSNQSTITKTGKFFRKYKLDELPQLVNVLIGDMSLVGPRPDVPGFADKLEGDDRIILTVKPGITGPASLKFKDEEVILSKVDNPSQYNLDIIWPQKVALNKRYVAEWSFYHDIKLIWETIFGQK